MEFTLVASQTSEGRSGMGTFRGMRQLLSVILAALELASISEGRKLRILALHGHLSNGDEICRSLHSWDTSILNLVDFTCIDAPFKARNDGFSWSTPVEGLDLNAADETVGIASVIDHIRNTGPYDGIFGHSEGGCVAGILGGIIAKRMEVLGRRVPDENPPRFVIITEGGVWDNLPQKVFTSPVKMKSFHVAGLYDQFLASEVLLASKYENPILEFVEMPHTRLTPQYMDERLKTSLTSFLQSVMNEHDVEGDFEYVARPSITSSTL